MYDQDMLDKVICPKCKGDVIDFYKHMIQSTIKDSDGYALDGYKLDCPFCDDTMEICFNCGVVGKNSHAERRDRGSVCELCAEDVGCACLCYPPPELSQMYDYGELERVEKRFVYKVREPITSLDGNPISQAAALSLFERGIYKVATRSEVREVWQRIPKDGH